MSLALAPLAARHHALGAVDKSDFQRKPRILQSLWHEQQDLSRYASPTSRSNSRHGMSLMLARPVWLSTRWRSIRFRISAITHSTNTAPAKAHAKMENSGLQSGWNQCRL